MKALALLLRDEKTISAYEVHTSQLVPILLRCLATQEREDLFKTAFAVTAQELPPDLDTR